MKVGALCALVGLGKEGSSSPCDGLPLRIVGRGLLVSGEAEEASGCSRVKGFYKEIHVL
jgi:hypothetical protein